MNIFEKLKNGLSKTKNNLADKISDVLNLAVKIDDDLYDELEEILITSDIGVETTLKIMDELKSKVNDERIKDPKEVKNCLKRVLKEMLGSEKSSFIPEKRPAIILVVGVNGVGKTTTIGKMAAKYKKAGLSVILAAADTFRAAAVDQLEIWKQRANVDIIKNNEGSDPAAVIFDAIGAAKSRKTDILLCDTAGRLHNKKNLMDELSKINKIIDREYSEAYKEVLLVLDATTGQNAIIQAKDFMEIADVSGIVLTKLDGTAKGGIVFAIKDELNIPVKLIGIGEGIDDLQEFNPDEFVDALF